MVIIILLQALLYTLFQVGVLLHDTNFTYKDTQQVARERQHVELHTAGLYEIQTLEVSLDYSVVNESNVPSLVVHWGGRQTPPLSVLELGTQCQLQTCFIMLLL